MHELLTQVAIVAFYTKMTKKIRDISWVQQCSEDTYLTNMIKNVKKKGKVQHLPDLCL